MKEFLKKHYKKLLVIPFDISLIPFFVICRLLSGLLLEKTNYVCTWVLLGGQCVTCGGTHFVNDFLSGRLHAAFLDNQLLFVVAIYFFISLILLNAWCLFDLEFAKHCLIHMYGFIAFGIFVLLMIWFVILRNIPAFINVTKILLAIFRSKYGA